jgi:hypothetical protein
MIIVTIRSNSVNSVNRNMENINENIVENMENIGGTKAVSRHDMTLHSPFSVPYCSLVEEQGRLIRRASKGRWKRMKVHGGRVRRIGVDEGGSIGKRRVEWNS